MKILIFGASGLLGRKLFNDFSKDHEVLGTYFSKPSPSLVRLDLTKKKEFKDLIKKFNPEMVINSAALTSSVKCEKEPKLSKSINYISAVEISKICKKKKIPIVFISSSYVFDGECGNYSEKDRVNPLTTYGKHKALSEKKISKMKNSLILRLDAIYGYNKGRDDSGFIKKILDKEEIFLGNLNQIRSPLFIDDLPRIILTLIYKGKGGIFHIAGPEKMTMLNFVKALGSLAKEGPKINLLEEKKLLVKPLKDSSLNISKIKSLGIETTTMHEALRIIKKRL